MSARFRPLPQLEGAQSLASNPSGGARLSASAGTGKTQVLTARVLRLLLQGARPESILCLTFTKAAAAEMANRIGARLAAWVRLKDPDLKKDLFALGEPNDPITLDRARRLFARVLDCPGGLKIQTIHSFAQSLLAAFPDEAGLAPGFRPIEGRAEQELVRLTLADLIADAENQGDEALIRDVQCLSRRLGEGGAVEYLQACARNAEALERMGPRETLELRVRALLALPDGPVEDAIVADCTDGSFDLAMFERLLAANRAWGSGVKARTIVANLEKWLASTPGERAAQLGDLGECIVKKDGDICVPAAGQLAAEPDYAALASEFADWRAGLLSLCVRDLLARDMAAGLRAGQAFATAYTHAKRAAGVADFNDLIEWTRHLLSRPGMGEWVRFKLDRQVDHVLVDEAQDTNAAQWEIIDRLVEEFFAGLGAGEERHRTLFMVGDLKQAIYAFQGSDPKRFQEVGDRYKRLSDELRATDETVEFRDLSIAASFRSAQGVLDVVDAVIGTVGHEALALAEPPPPHRAHHAARAGTVELWQPFAVEEAADDSEEGEERWISLRDRHYATALAERIRQMIADAPVLASTGRPLSPGDILVLVRSRKELASLIVARLFAAGVQVAGVDRLHLHEPLAVQDLLAAVKFAVQPHDDLSLACLLVSPLVGWDQEQLRSLAYGRKSSLWRELRQRAGERELFSLAHEALSALLDMADFTTPSRFLETILSGPMQGRRKLYGRLGFAARDAIEELMNSALEFERNEIASLDRFLAWFSRGTVDVQRDPGESGNEVRVMTVHGAKGLEAPVVILADATADPARLGRTPLTVKLLGSNVEDVPFLRPRKEERCPPFARFMEEEEERDRQEHMRLLYVALTRAADHLIVSGVRPKEKKDGSDPRPANCWHLVVEQAMTAMAAATGDGHVVLRHSSGEGAARDRKQDKVQVPPAPVPAWASTPAPPEARPPRPLAPSAILDDDLPSPPPSPDLAQAAQRGVLLHRLFERLPGVEPAHRRDAALSWLQRSVGVGDEAQRWEIAEAACSILDHPDFAELFGPGSLAEAPIAATLADGRVIAGTVDRLLVDDSKVRVIDFKTGRHVPASAAEVPRYHLAQMTAYGEALRVIFPGRTVEAALLYTAGPRLIALDC
jgi:ATP-dependent helicase/nuclease subunit A